MPAASLQKAIDEKLTRAAGEENSDPAVAEEFLAAETGQPVPVPQTSRCPARADRTAPAPGSWPPDRHLGHRPGRPSAVS
ncbi:MAG TPA: hypothetical protein VFQ68_44535 [Streptosporangiaceae bacterium]|nr:hypothetical protein [Streptosporangiaceae bacterium]